MLKLLAKAQHAMQALKGENGQDLIEYALLGGLIAVVSIAAMTSLGVAVVGVYKTVSTSL